MVLGTLQRPTFEPLEDTDSKWLSLKTAFQLSITSARKVSEIQALSVHSDCCRWLLDEKRVVLQLNTAFLLKALSNFHLSQLVKLYSAPTEGSDWQAAQRLVSLCPVRALALYVSCTQLIWIMDQLFIAFHPGILGRPVSKSRLSRWVVEAIRQAYASAGVPLPFGVQAHLTLGWPPLGPCGGASLSLPFVQQQHGSWVRPLLGFTAWTWQPAPLAGSRCWVPLSKN